MTDSAAKSVAILGFGTAGFNAVVALRSAGYEGEIRVFSDHDLMPYSPILTSYYAGGEKTWEECFPWSAAEIEDLNITWMKGCAVESLDVEGHVVCTAQGDFPYTKCVIATGATPMPYGFPKDCGYEPIQLRTMADAERLREVLCAESCQHVLVSGASMVALKTVEAALRRGVKVTQVGMNPHVLDMTALPEAAERFERGLKANGVELKLGQVISSVTVVEGEGGRRKLAVTFSSGDTGEYDEICVAHGMKCNLDFLAEGALEMDRALLVDEFMRTSNADVYAAGDVVQALELISGQPRIVGIWKNAAVQGFVAGQAIAAELAGAEPEAKQAYKGSIATNTIAVMDTLFISGGTMELGEHRYTTIRENDDMIVVYVWDRSAADEAAARGANAEAVAAIEPQLVGFNITADHDEEGGLAYDTGAMLTLRIEAAAKQALKRK